MVFAAAFSLVEALCAAAFCLYFLSHLLRSHLLATDAWPPSRTAFYIVIFAFFSLFLAFLATLGMVANQTLRSSFVRRTRKLAPVCGGKDAGKF